MACVICLQSVGLQLYPKVFLAPENRVDETNLNNDANIKK